LGGGNNTGLQLVDIEECIQALISARILSSEFLNKLRKESDLFQEFMKWLLYGFHHRASDCPEVEPQSTSIRAQQYAVHFFKQSPTMQYLGRNPAFCLSLFKEQGGSINELCQNPSKFKIILGFMDLIDHIELLCRKVFSSSQNYLLQKIHTSHPILLTPFDIPIYDIKMTYINGKPVTCIAFKHQREVDPHGISNFHL
jgi:hypothetical protein